MNDLIDYINVLNDDDYLKYLKQCICQCIEQQDDVSSNGMLSTTLFLQKSFGILRLRGYKEFIISKNLIDIIDACDLPRKFTRLRLPFPAIKIGNCLIFENEYACGNTGFSLHKMEDGIFERFNFDVEKYQIVSEKLPNIIKILYYLNSENPDIVECENRGSFARKVREGKKASIVYIGKSVKRIKGLPQGFTIDKKFIVRGHWRNQPTKLGVKVVFIEPYYKGSDDMQEIINTYSIKRKSL